MIEIRKQAAEDYSFVLKTKSGQTLLSSIIYANRETVEEVVSSLQTSKVGRNTFERKTNHSGKFIFSLKNKNGEVIGHSLPYQSEAGMENGIKNLMNSINSLSETDKL